MKVLRSEHGQQFILIALLLPFLIAFLGLVVDVGNVFVHQRRVQNAADAAAAAAGMVLYPQGRTVALSTAAYYATRNGYTDNGGTVRVWASNPPSSGAYANNVRYVQVEVQEEVDPIFAGVVWDGKFTLHARATAGYTLKALGADLWALKDTPTCDGYTSMTMNGNPGLIRAVNGIVQVNSPCNNAVSVGNGDIEARVINISGPGYSHKPNSIFTPAATLNAPPIPDPLASLPAPSTALPCHHYTKTELDLVTDKYRPGIYPSDFTPDFNHLPQPVEFDGSGGECDGVFYFRGSLSIPNNSRVKIEKGMFYMASGGLTLGGNATLNGSAPTDGPYAGLLVFMARNNDSEFYLHGTPVANCTAAGASVSGILYLPAGTLRVQGTSDDCFSGALIAWRIYQNGNATTTLVAYPGQIPPTTVTDAQVE
jgi:hypothetical protein